MQWKFSHLPNLSGPAHCSNAVRFGSSNHHIYCSDINASSDECRVSRATASMNVGKFVEAMATAAGSHMEAHRHHSVQVRQTLRDTLETGPSTTQAHHWINLTRTRESIAGGMVTEKGSTSVCVSRCWACMGAQGGTGAIAVP